MSMRVTTATMFRSSARNLQTSIANLAAAQNVASSQKKLTKPSDDPSAVADAIDVRAALAQNTQYSRNINDANSWLTTADGALSQTSSLLRKARDLVIQGANGSMSPSARNDVATQLEAIKSSLLSQANTTYLGRSVFAGTSDTAAAFDPTTYDFTGVPGSSVERRVGAGQTVRVDVDGSQVFGTGSDSVFSDLDTIIENLRTGGDVSSGIALIDARTQAVAAAQGQVGAQQNATTQASNLIASQKVTLQSQQANIEDADTAQSIMELNMRNNIYTAALLVTSKSLQTSLMDFLR